MSTYYADNKSSSLSNTQANGYDALSRLTSATAKNLSGSTFWSQTYSYDRYGNGTCSGSGLCTSMSYNTSTNRLTAVGTATPSFDAAGDLTSDPTNSPSRAYAWDAESRMTTVDSGSTLTYIYNALGQRVEVDLHSGAQYEYLFDPNGNELGLCTGGMDTGGRCWNTSWVRAGGRVLGYYDLYESRFDHRNNIGSDTVATIHDGSVDSDQTLYPFGQNWNYSGTHLDGEIFGGFQNVESWFNPWLNPTNTRKYNSLLYRWLTPDPVQDCVMNPQGQNLYGYVKNNPVNETDPSGMGPGGEPGDVNDAVGSCRNWYYAVTHAECKYIPDPFPPIILFPPAHGGGGGGGSSGGKTGTCTDRTGKFPIAGVSEGNLCAGTDHPYFLWSWACDGNVQCCLGKAGEASKKCSYDGPDHRYHTFYGNNDVRAPYGTCCSSKNPPRPM